MARNVEVKARVRDAAALRQRVAAIAPGPGEAIEQQDTFFPCVRGRLKYRRLDALRGELIHYERPDESGPKLSRYTVVPCEGHALRDALAAALGVRAELRKRRMLHLSGRTRIHLDRVDGLGDFLELEVVLADGEDEAAGEAEAQALLAKLGVAREDLVTGAYVDLLERGSDRLSAAEGPPVWHLVVPQFPVRDVHVTTKWYGEVLGLPVDFTWEDEYGSVCAGGVKINFVRQQEPPRGQVCCIDVDDPDALHARCLEAGAPIVMPLANQAWGLREFAVEDPNGHWLRISRPLREDES